MTTPRSREREEEWLQGEGGDGGQPQMPRSPREQQWGLLADRVGGFQFELCMLSLPLLLCCSIIMFVPFQGSFRFVSFRFGVDRCSQVFSF